ncbi:ABC-three component system middle component 1 [Streptococcus australis]|uniref:Uncharacterized protein n=1 Tax=Streptococcus australis TaxID=113107 RepID=A0A4V0BZB3_9STRE|nr:ABC-three component system middle component 1 [Streptococcus australis]VTS73092.1 Uncharacterised protein [Streptococcus australis]
MDSFLQQILEQHNFHKCDEHLELWGGEGNEFFLIQEYSREDFKSSSEGGSDFFTCEQTNKLISCFEKLNDNKIKKNTSLFVTIKVDELKQSYESLRNMIMKVEEDEYYFRKYVILYTEEGLSRLNSNIEDLLNYIQSISPEGEYLFDKFESDMFFDTSYFIAIQLIIKLPFASLHHSDNHFEIVENKIQARIEMEGLNDHKKQVDNILEIFSGVDIRKQLEDEASGLLDSLNQILGD